MELKNKQQNFLSLILSAFFLGVEISIIASIIFTSFYEENKTIFTIFTIIITLITLVLILYINTKYCKLCYTFELPIVFNTQENKFIDIPHCPSSVNARLLFNDLSDKQKNAIINSDPFENKAYIDFCISFIGQLIFSRIFYNSSRILDENGHSVNRDFFKDLLVKYKYIDIDTILNSHFLDASLSLQLPKGVKLTSVTDNEIILKSMQGYICFNWSITTTFPCQDNVAVLAQSGNISTENCLSTIIRVNLSYGYNLLNLFNKKQKF